MKSFLFSLSTMVLLIACARTQPGSEDRIVGQWSWGRPITPVSLAFERNHTGKLGEDPCEWSYEHDQYRIWPKGAPENILWYGIIDDKDRLVLNNTKKSREFKKSEPWIFQREGATEPAQAPISPEQAKSIKRSLIGEWRYAYKRKSVFASASAFDRVTFSDRGEVQTTSTYLSKHFEGHYALQGNILKMTEPESGKVTDELTVSMEDQGATLVLTPKVQDPAFAVEWVYMRPDHFLPNEELAGIWEGKAKRGEPFHSRMKLDRDGRLTLSVIDEHGKVIGANTKYDKLCEYYFLCASPFGKVMTTVFVNRAQAVQTNSMVYERKNDKLITRPIDLAPDGSMKLARGLKERWVLEKGQ